MKSEWSNYLKGTDLCFEDRIEALRTYTNRYTSEHRPAWAEEYPYKGHPHYSSDIEWLDRTLFPVTEYGRLDKRCSSCISMHQSWPHGKPQFNERY